MKKLLIITCMLLLFPAPGSGLEYGNGLYSPGWWFGMSNDSFGFGIPSEGDDLHTTGFQGGYTTGDFSATLFYDIYTYRGAAGTDPARTDRVCLLLGREGGITLGLMDLCWQLSATLGLDGNIGGYWIQYLFHITFSNYRPIPQLSSYDDFRIFGGLQPRGEIAFNYGGGRGGLELDALLIYPWLITLDPALFIRYQGGDSLVRLSAAWTFTLPSENFRTYNLVRRQAAGLWLNGYLATGGLFYHFSYNPFRQLTDGRIGYQWSQRNPGAAPPLWDIMEAGIELLNLGPGMTYEENTLWTLFFASGVPGGYFYIQTKNGGQYMDNACTYNAKNTVYGAGYEQHLSAELFDPFIGMNLFIEHVREHTVTLYQSTTLADMGVLGSELHMGLGFWLPALPDVPDKIGLRVAAFLTLPHLTFGDGVNAPGLAPAQWLRWGIRASLAAGT